MLNPHFEKLKTAYIFPIIEKKLNLLQKEHPNQKIYNLGVGDVSLPLLPEVAKAMTNAILEMTQEPRGYGPCGGYDFLKEAIWKNEYQNYSIDCEEIFISDGANTDVSSLQELFDNSITVLITDPTYPVYRDANLLAGKNVQFLPLHEEEGFIPHPPKQRADLVYLCTPSNPTGTAMDRDALTEWILWAKKHKAILIIDNVYHCFISSEEIPPSIYELPGSQEVAIEVRSFSKKAGFTGLRCGYCVVPKNLHIPQLHDYWKKRVDIKTNGISYPIQKGAEASYEPTVQKKLQEQIALYQTSSDILQEALNAHSQIFFGGKHSPYLWWKTPQGKNAWEFFDQLLNHCRILAIPGSSFGSCGEGFVRLSCFLSPSQAKEAAHALYHHFAAV